MSKTKDPWISINRATEAEKGDVAATITRFAEDAADCIDNCGLKGDELSGYIAGVLKEYTAALTALLATPPQPATEKVQGRTIGVRLCSSEGATKCDHGVALSVTCLACEAEPNWSRPETTRHSDGCGTLPDCRIHRDKTLADEPCNSCGDTRAYDRYEADPKWIESACLHLRVREADGHNDECADCGARRVRGRWLCPSCAPEWEKCPECHEPYSWVLRCSQCGHEEATEAHDARVRREAWEEAAKLCERVRCRTWSPEECAWQIRSQLARSLPRSGSDGEGVKQHQDDKGARHG